MLDWYAPMLLLFLDAVSNGGPNASNTMFHHQNTSSKNKVFRDASRIVILCIAW